MYILGVNSGPHDGSAALVRDGELLVMIEQERVSRNKRAAGESPCQAVAACLETAGITLADVATVAVGWDVARLAAVEQRSYDPGRFAHWLLGVPADSDTLAKLRLVPHHQAHAASALWTSGSERAAIIVVDGRGEDCATSVGIGDADGITFFRTWDVTRSLGHLYGFAAEWAGFTEWDGGKLMGLASYGRPVHPVPLSPDPADGYRVDGLGGLDLAPAYAYFELRRRVRDAFGQQFPFSASTGQEPMAYADFAASVQAGLERCILSLARELRERTKAKTLVLAGGVALNCSMNGVLHRSEIFDDVYIPPVPHDAGVSLGAALWAWRTEGPTGARATGARMTHAYWGPELSASDQEGALTSAGLNSRVLPDDELADAVAEFLADGLLVGWWNGRSEVGQRALGARSILCDPRDRSAVARLNNVKGREVWRPLAPSVLEGAEHLIFGRELPSSADFMLSAWPVTEAGKRMIPAAVHVDGTARPQIVRHRTNPAIHRLISAFQQRTGVPAVINTSFNLAGEPNVFTAHDAVSTYLRSDLDILVLGNYVVDERDHSVDPLAHRATPQPAMDFLLWEPE